MRWSAGHAGRRDRAADHHLGQEHHAGAVHLRLLVASLPGGVEHRTGLNSTDTHLRDLFRLYGASKSQSMFWARLPSALPYYLAGLRISGGLL